MPRDVDGDRDEKDLLILSPASNRSIVFIHFPYGATKDDDWFMNNVAVRYFTRNHTVRGDINKYKNIFLQLFFVAVAIKVKSESRLMRRGGGEGKKKL